MRVNIAKTKNAEHIYIMKSFRKNGKSTSTIFKKLGRMEDLLPLHNNNRQAVIDWAQEQAAYYTEQEKEENLTIPLVHHQGKQLNKDESSLYNGGYLFLKSIFHDLHLDSLCSSISSKYDFSFDLSTILEVLIYTRIIHPSSKFSSYQYAGQLIEKPNFDLHHIYRALSILSKENDYIQSTIYKNTSRILSRNTQVLYYDCANYFFEIEQEYEDKQYGEKVKNIGLTLLFKWAYLWMVMESL